jgi:hypothetical protein
LAKFKKENKELLSYILFESFDEASYIEGIKSEMDEQFENINRKSNYTFKKSVQKILRYTKRFSRYSDHKETEIDLLIYFCIKMKEKSYFLFRNTALINFYSRQIVEIRKKISSLHEDLQYDYNIEMKELNL